MFQSYALFSHLTVAENVAFGLRFAKASKEETRSRVGEALSLVRMQEFRDRKPHQLSGGQQQRVALARALILNPSVLLLDEPLGALDAKLRKALQIELKALQEQVGITFVYVTHDQEEALTMADRLAVMNEGRIEQVGSPREVYEEPASAYVADFLGVSNMLDAQAIGTDSDGRCRVRVGDFELLASCGHTSARGSVKVVVRPERVRVEAPPEDRREPVAGEDRTRRLRRRHLPTRGHPRPREPDPVHAGQRRGRVILRPGSAGVSVPAVRSPARAAHRTPPRRTRRKAGASPAAPAQANHEIT